VIIFVGGNFVREKDISSLYQIRGGKVIFGKCYGGSIMLSLCHFVTFQGYRDCNSAVGTRINDPKVAVNNT